MENTTGSFQQKMDKEVVCRVCGQSPVNPMECVICGSRFCKLCVVFWGTKSSPCPKDCTDTLLREVKLNRNTNKCTTNICVSSGPPMPCPENCGELILPGGSAKTHRCIDTLKTFISDNCQAIERIKSETKRLKCELAKKTLGNHIVTCANCKDENFPGISFHCTVCKGFDLCHHCYKISQHPHKIERIVPKAFYTELICCSIISNTIHAQVQVISYEEEKCSLRFACTEIVSFSSNDFFEVNSEEMIIKEFTFLKDKYKTKGYYEFYLECVVGEDTQFFGIPFRIFISKR